MSEKIISPKLMMNQFSILNIEYRTQNTLKIDIMILKIKLKKHDLVIESMSTEIENSLIDNTLSTSMIIIVNN